MRTTLRMRTFILALGADEDGSSRSLPQEPITVPYIAVIIIARIYLALLLYKKGKFL